MLEESSLETIETLNATVEAKDPYTAGHSQRCADRARDRRASSSLAASGSTPSATARLFHDIGKIAVPTRS